MSEKKGVGVNYIYNLSYQILSIITPLITAPYLARVLGAREIGRFGYIESISSYFVLFSTLGLTTFGQREISYYQQSKEKRSVIFWEINIIEVCASFICGLVYVLFSLKQGSDAGLYLVLILNIVAVVFNISWFYQGMEKFKTIATRNIFFKLVELVYIFTFIKREKDLIYYLFGKSFFLLINNASLWITIKKYVEKPRMDELHPTRHIKDVIVLFVPTIAIQVYTVLDKTMLGMITRDFYQNGYYEQSMKIVKSLLTVVTSVSVVMMPRIANKFKCGEKKDIIDLMEKTYKVVWLLALPLCVGVMIISDKFVPWFFGDGYDEVVILLKILSLLFIAIGVNSVTGMQYLIATNRQSLYTVSVIIGAGINFGLNMFLIGKAGARGAAMASVISEMSIAVIQFVMVRNELDIKKVIACSRTYIVACLGMGSSMMIVELFSLSAVCRLFIESIIGVIVYSAVLVMLKDEMFRYMFSSVCRSKRK